jgi:hypothetical protein
MQRFWCYRPIAPVAAGLVLGAKRGRGVLQAVDAAMTLFPAMVADMPKGACAAPVAEPLVVQVVTRPFGLY